MWFSTYVYSIIFYYILFMFYSVVILLYAFNFAFNFELFKFCVIKMSP